jgi:hypothetical protein
MAITDVQLQEMFDRQSIADLISRLGLMLDQKSFENATSVLTEDIVVQTGGGSSAGLAQVIDQAERNHRGVTHSVITNVLIDVHGDRADARANLIATFWPDPKRPDGTFAVRDRYRFEVIRTEQGWRLRRIESEPAWRSNGSVNHSERVDDNERLTSAPA